MYISTLRVRRRKVTKKRKEQMKMDGWCHMVTFLRMKAVRTMKRWVLIPFPSVLHKHPQGSHEHTQVSHKHAQGCTEKCT